MKLEADGIFEGVWQDDLMTAHFEIQSGPDPENGDQDPDILPHGLHPVSLCNRVLRSSTCARVARYQNHPGHPRRSGKNPLVFDYEVIPLWETPYQELLDKKRRGLLPFVPLSLDGASRE